MLKEGATTSEVQMLPATPMLSNNTYPLAVPEPISESCADQLAVAEEMNRIVVVLGMHRNGTSAITRSLETLGVDLGDRLMPAVASVNDKGFFEDMDVYRINVAVLASLERGWDDISLLHPQDWRGDAIDQLVFQAAVMLRGKLGHGTLGLKDPRMARLLPFWLRVFAQLELQPCFVLAVRNPLDVVASLLRRDDFSAEKSYYLWLEHMLESEWMTRHARRVFVSYEALLENPRQQLRRMASALHLPFTCDEQVLNDFTLGFLDPKLRHNANHIDDLALDPCAPEDLVQTFEIVQSFSQLLPSTPESDRALENLDAIRSRLKSHAPLLRFASGLDVRLAAERTSSLALRSLIEDNREELNNLRALVGKQANTIDTLTQHVAERDDLIVTRDALLNQQATVIDTLTQDLTKRDLLLVTRDALIESLQARWDRRWIIRVLRLIRRGLELI